MFRCLRHRETIHLLMDETLLYYYFYLKTTLQQFPGEGTVPKYVGRRRRSEPARPTLKNLDFSYLLAPALPNSNFSMKCRTSCTECTHAHVRSSYLFVVLGDMMHDAHHLLLNFWNEGLLIFLVRL